MKEAVAAPVGRLGPEGPIKKASSATNSGDGDLVYDHDRFHKFKAQHHYKYYIKHRIVVERGVEVMNLDTRTLWI
jgi:hypothetical protein